MRHVEGSAQLGELLLNFFGSLPVTFGGRCDAERAQQIRGGRTRVTRFAEDRMEALARQVVKHEIDNAPGVKSLFVHALVVGSHGPRKRPCGEKGGLNLRQWPATWGLLCNGRVNPRPIRVWLCLRPEISVGEAVW